MKQSTSLLTALFLASAATVPAAAYGAKSFTATVVWEGAPAENVPVLLRLSSAAINGFDYNDVTTSGFEIVDASDQRLPWEIDTWDPSGESLLWVLLPDYRDGATFTVRYGDAFPDANLPSSGVWTDYVGVWHLGAFDANAGSFGTFPSSTATVGIDGEKSEAAVANEAGVIGKSVKTCDAGAHTGSYKKGGVFVPDSGSNSPLDLGDTFAISGWFKHKNQDYYYDKLFFKRRKADNSSSPNGSFAIELTGGQTPTAQFSVRGSSSSNIMATPASLLDWTYLTFVYDGTTCSVYTNGTLLKSGTVTSVTDNDSPLCFGSASAGYLSSDGEACWCGWIDEVRLMDGVPTADWIAAEYHAMATALAYGDVTSSDTSAPVLAIPLVARNQDGSFGISAEVSENLPAAIVCEIGGTDYPMTTSDASVPATYSATISNLVAGTYVAVVRATGTGGTTVSSTCPTAFHAGALSVATVSNANEGMLSPGVFRVSRADLDASSAPALSFNVALSGTGLAAIAHPGITSATIPAGAAYVDISVTPAPAPAINADTQLTLTVSGSNIGQAANAQMTIVNADFNLSVRYVAADGSDANHGGTPELPMRTIGAALEILTAIAQTENCVIYVAPGLYPVSKKMLITGPIHVVGLDPDPSKVVVSNTLGASYSNQDQRLFHLDHADALVANLTMQNGQEYGIGGNFYIGTAGGVVSNCVIEAGGATGNDASAGGGHLAGGTVTHAVFRKNTCDSGSREWSRNRPGVLLLEGYAHAENCLFADNLQDKEVTLINANGTSAMRNCTIANSTLMATNAYCEEWSALRIASGATVQNVVIAGVTNAVDGAACPPTGTVANFQNGAFDGDATGLPAGTVIGTVASFFRDFDSGDYRPAAGGPLVGKGANYGGMAAADLSGKQKRLIGKNVDIGCFEANTAHTMVFVK